MKKKSCVLLTGLLAFCALAQATSIAIDFARESASPGMTWDGNYAVNRYLGTVNGRVIPALYCDGFLDYIYMGQQSVDVYSSDFAAADTTLASDTRYGSAGRDSRCAAGTEIYAEVSWLVMHMERSSVPEVAANNAAIQQAVQMLVGGSPRISPSAEQNSQPDAGTESPRGTETVQSYSEWIAEAENYYTENHNYVYNQTGLQGYANLIDANGQVVAAGGSEGCNGIGCFPSGLDTHADSATPYFPQSLPNSLPVSNKTVTPTPEPASFYLIACGLWMCLAARRHKLK